ncbi:MAG: hypothetical protein JNG86_15705 [Verrucomicrobiaceae bacterium]|nr:hypothetical protein [Verrucomicrobiaceae bacterium]
MKMHATRLLFACIGLAGLAALPFEAHAAKKAPVAASNKKGKAPTASSLVDDMRKAVIYIVQQSEPINDKAKQTKPYWQGLSDTWDGLDLMEEGITKKNAAMLEGLEAVGRGLTQTAASWGMIRDKYPKLTVGRGITALHNSYEMYAEHYGPAVARYRQKAPLSAKEKQHLAASSKQLDTLFANLNKVYQKAKAKSWQERLLKDLVGLINDLDRTRQKGKGKLGYASYLYQWNRLQNAMWAYSEIISIAYPEFYEVWAVLEDDIEVMDVCFGSEEEMYQSYAEWEYTEVSIEEYDDYYEEVAVIETISEEEEESLEEDLEEYEEEEADVEDAELEEEFDEELAEEEIESEESLFEEVGESYGDDDGDGVEDEEDTDDDNDGTADAEDTDDDCDGVCDTADADTEEEEEEELEEEDDNGIAEECEGDYDCGGCCAGGCDGCCEE